HLKKTCYPFELKFSIAEFRLLYVPNYAREKIIEFKFAYPYDKVSIYEVDLKRSEYVLIQEIYISLVSS
ncbi:MAG: hypothetical protein ACK4GJ_05805, partial [bacterium]